MFKLDDNLLRELGLGTLPADEKNRMLQHIYETLEMRVGMKLAEQMSNEQLDEFEGFIDRNDEAGALKWLESNFPNYKQVVADELEALKTEVKASSAQIVAASQAAQAQQQMQPGMTQAGISSPGGPQPGIGQSFQAPQAYPQAQPMPPTAGSPAGYPPQQTPMQPAAWNQPASPQPQATPQPQVYQPVQDDPSQQVSSQAQPTINNPTAADNQPNQASQDSPQTN